MSKTLADKSYIALKVQSDATTPVKPTIHFPLVSESIRVNPNYAADRRMKGLDWKSDELLRGERKIEGDIVLYGDALALGHILNMTYNKASTSGDSDGYTHAFVPGDGDSYTIEIPRGGYAQRIWGVRGDRVKFDYVDNKLQATVSIKALGQFYAARLGAALSGSSTSLSLSTEYDLRPTDGLKIGDVIMLVKDDASVVELTLTSVDANGVDVGFSSASITAAAGNAIFLKAQTPSIGSFKEPLYMGNTLVGFGADSSDADTAASAKATATPCYNLALTLANNLFDAAATGSMGPAQLLNQVKEAQLELSQIFNDPTQYATWLANIKQAITAIAKGRAITSAGTPESLTVKLHKAKLMTNEEPLEVGSYIFDRQTFEALYDSDDAKSMEISVVNSESGSNY